MYGMYPMCCGHLMKCVTLCQEKALFFNPAAVVSWYEVGDMLPARLLAKRDLISNCLSSPYMLRVQVRVPYIRTCVWTTTQVPVYCSKVGAVTRFWGLSSFLACLLPRKKILSFLTCPMLSTRWDSQTYSYVHSVKYIQYNSSFKSF